MARCYDFDLRDNMVLRAVIALAVVVWCHPARAEWRAVATPDRADLPTVEVECGYPGGYISLSNTPIRMRARTGATPFDGYIGFAVKVDGVRTIDVPVISRADLGPNAAWTFDTWLDIRGGERSETRRRELVVVWRDAKGEEISEKNVGRPPWSFPRPLRIAADGETVASDRYLGEKAVVLPSSMLATEAEWYYGFSSVVAPIAVWFGLPERIREAIFRSGSSVYFYGPVVSIPRMSAVDRALLPVELLTVAGGPVSVPWPYEAGADRAVPQAVTWRAKPGAHVLGSPSLPYLVANDLAVFASSEEAVREPLPGFAVSTRGEAYFDDLPLWRRLSVRPAEIVREYGPLVGFCLAVLISVAGWLAIRRVPKRVVLPLLVIVGLAVIAVREWIRPIEPSFDGTTLTLVAPGVVEVSRVRRDAGLSPRILPKEAREALAGGLTWRMSWHSAEVRNSDTPPGLGTLLAGWNWSSSVRHAYRRELASPASIRIVSQNADRMVVDFESKTPIDYVAAQWNWNGPRQAGEARAGGRLRGRVTVHSGRLVFTDLRRWDHSHGSSPREAWGDGAPVGSTMIALSRVRRNATTVIRYVVPSSGSIGPPFRIAADLNPDQNGVYSAALVLPASIPANGTARIDLESVSPASLAKLRAMTFDGPVGSFTIALRLWGAGATQPEISQELRRIAPGGGIIRVRIDPRESGADLSRARTVLVVRKGKQ